VHGKVGYTYHAVTEGVINWTFNFPTCIFPIGATCLVDPEDWKKANEIHLSKSSEKLERKRARHL